MRPRRFPKTFKAGLWARSAPRPKRQKDELGATTSAGGVSLIKTVENAINLPSAMGNTTFRVLLSPNRKTATTFAGRGTVGTL